MSTRTWPAPGPPYGCRCRHSHQLHPGCPLGSSLCRHLVLGDLMLQWCAPRNIMATSNHSPVSRRLRTNTLCSLIMCAVVSCGLSAKGGAVVSCGLLAKGGAWACLMPGGSPCMCASFCHVAVVHMGFVPRLEAGMGEQSHLCSPDSRPFGRAVALQPLPCRIPRTVQRRQLASPRPLHVHQVAILRSMRVRSLATLWSVRVQQIATTQTLHAQQLALLWTAATPLPGPSGRQVPASCPAGPSRNRCRLGSLHGRLPLT